MSVLKIGEKRMYNRIGLNGRVFIKKKDGKLTLLQAPVDNLSFGGFRMRSHRRFGVGDNLEFVLKTKFLEAPLSGKATIRHVDRSSSSLLPSFNTGIEFVHTDKAILRSAIKNHLKKKDRRRARRIGFIKNWFYVIKIVPLVIVYSWLVARAMDTMLPSIQEEQRYSQKLRQGIIHYLYNAR